VAAQVGCHQADCPRASRGPTTCLSQACLYTQLAVRVTQMLHVTMRFEMFDVKNVHLYNCVNCAL
jgi:hypothetical protein